MSATSPEQNLISLYGEDALDLVLKEIQDLRSNSNIPFDSEYVKVALSFLGIKAEEIIQGTKQKRSLRSLVSESFGEAAIYKYNCCGAT
ncbi:hypothetical protein [Brevibacillus porteri]|uniref:hypothetical protein n=1 Tax=Brevibacillus porteri TaxID=2126350 RepID=UPI0036402CAC